MVQVHFRTNCQFFVTGAVAICPIVHLLLSCLRSNERKRTIVISTIRPTSFTCIFTPQIITFTVGNTRAIITCPAPLIHCLCCRWSVYWHMIHATSAPYHTVCTLLKKSCKTRNSKPLLVSSSQWTFLCSSRR